MKTHRPSARARASTSHLTSPHHISSYIISSHLSARASRTVQPEVVHPRPRAHGGAAAARRGGAAARRRFAAASPEARSADQRRGAARRRRRAAASFEARLVSLTKRCAGAAEAKRCSAGNKKCYKARTGVQHLSACALAVQKGGRA